MTKRKVATPDPAAKLTLAEAIRIAAAVDHDMHFEQDSLARFMLLLRWLAYRADDNDREELYIHAEETACPFMDGVDEAVRAQMSRQLELLRKEGAR